MIWFTCLVHDHELVPFCMDRANDENALEIDFGAIEYASPRVTLPSSIGKGVHYTAKYMSTKLCDGSDGSKQLLDHLLALSHKGQVWIINSRKQHHLHDISINHH